MHSSPVKSISNLAVMPIASDCPTSVQEFVFKFSSPLGSTCILRAPICLANNLCPAELTHRLVQAHNLPCYIQQGLEMELKNFLNREMLKYQDLLVTKSVDKTLCGNGKTDYVDEMVGYWTNTYQQLLAVEINERLVDNASTERSYTDHTQCCVMQEVLDYANTDPSAADANDRLLCEVYHSLIHSQSLDTVLGLEQTYATEVQKMLDQRDTNIAVIENRQQVEMESAVNSVGVNYTDEQINRLTQRHFENLQMVEHRWTCELTKLQDTQRLEYKDWLLKLHEQSQQSDGMAPQYSETIRNLALKLASSLKASATSVPCSVSMQQVVQREESFTVHLGAQLKTTHNLRLISADIMNFCRHRRSNSRSRDSEECGELSVHRLQTAMSLYSNSLCGLVLLVDNRLNSYMGIKREFAKVCEQSTDFHFANLDKQFESICQCSVEAKDWRMKKKVAGDNESSKLSTKSSTSSMSSSASDERDESSRGGTSRQTSSLTTGDFYVTRHSNLSEVHVVFHLVCDDSTSTSSDMSSRHPVILAYRNVLKLCFRHDVRHVTLPLLLVQEMSEEMTISWCLKRAELVFKCVKGFVMELALWSGQDSFTIQFVVPKSLSDEAFVAICTMLPTIFRMSNPVIAK